MILIFPLWILIITQLKNKLVCAYLVQNVWLEFHINPADKGLMLIHDTHKPTELAQKKTIALIWVMSTSILMPACVLNFLFVWFSKWVAFLKRLHLNWINKKCKGGGNWGDK